MMHSVVFTGWDYGLITQQWWRAWHPQGIDGGLLSPHGVAVLDNTGPVAIAHMFPSIQTDICFLGWVVANPSSSKFKIGKALKLLMQSAQDEAKRLGYPILYVQSESTAVHKVCAQADFSAGDFLQIYIKRLV